MKTALTKTFSSHRVGVAAEAIAAAQFARCGYDVSVQYGANQPEYDLLVAQDDRLLKVSVKGSQDGGWGLTQSHMSNRNYHGAIQTWLERHRPKTVVCFVQFKNTSLDELPRIYLARPSEVAECLRMSANGRGETVLRERHVWGARAVGAGTIDCIPEEWKFSSERIDAMFKTEGITAF
jgi:hypothetical protein